VLFSAWCRAISKATLYLKTCPALVLLEVPLTKVCSIFQNLISQQSGDCRPATTLWQKTLMLKVIERIDKHLIISAATPVVDVLVQ
jgi:hypothetical protein